MVSLRPDNYVPALIGEHQFIDRLVDSKYQDFVVAQEDRIMLTEAIEMLKENLKQSNKIKFF